MSQKVSTLFPADSEPGFRYPPQFVSTLTLAPAACTCKSQHATHQQPLVPQGVETRTAAASLPRNAANFTASAAVPALVSKSILTPSHPPALISATACAINLSGLAQICLKNLIWQSPPVRLPQSGAIQAGLSPHSPPISLQEVDHQSTGCHWSARGGREGRVENARVDREAHGLHLLVERINTCTAAGSAALPFG